MSSTGTQRRLAVRSVVVSFILVAMVACAGSPDGTATTAGGDAATTTAGGDAVTTTAGGDTATTTAVSDEWAAIEQAAREEGEVFVYETTIPTAIAIAAAFERKYPEITVRLVPGDTNLPARITAEREAGFTSVDTIASGFLEFHNDPEYMVDLRAAGLPILSELTWPEGSVAENGTWIGARYQLMGVAYNTELYPGGAELQTWPDVLDPELQGNIVTHDLVGGGDTLPSVITALQMTHGDEFIEALGAQELWVAEGAATGALQALGSGQAWLTLPMNPAQAFDVKGTGAPIEYKVLYDPLVAAMGVGGVIKESPNPNAALVWANFRHGPEGFAALCESVGPPTSNGQLAPFEEEVPECMPRPDVELTEWPRYPSGDPERNRLMDMLGFDTSGL